jgi:hypothetical protein
VIAHSASTSPFGVRARPAQSDDSERDTTRVKQLRKFMSTVNTTEAVNMQRTAITR